MIKIDNIVLNPSFNCDDLVKAIVKKLNVKQNEIKNIVYLKKSIDARRKPNVKIILSVAVELNSDKTCAGFQSYEPDFSGLSYEKINKKVLNPVVVGFGPAGMFCALSLAYMGLNPIVIEQGKCVEEREKDVSTFWETGKLNEFSNVQFGEGGAGTFSDGKLNTNLNSPYCKKVINEFVLHGAPKEISYINKPHIGSDNLKNVVKNIRNKIISLGGKILFQTQFINYNQENDKICSVVVKNLNNNNLSTIETNYLVLAVGHSARPTFELLYNKGLNIQQKPFSMGVRIEQKQSDINFSQYGCNNKSLPSADYKLAVHLPNGRSVFTFCMCPGGVVVSSASNNGEIVTNGMSNFKRDGENANSAVLVNVVPSDYESSHPLAGIYFQQKYEQLAFALSNNGGCPAQSVGEFLTGKKRKLTSESRIKSI